MHQLKISIRKILPAEIPTVTPIGEPPRPMNAQELLNLGIVPLGNDLYSCVHQEERDPETLEWRPRPGQNLLGEAVSEGLLHDRHARLPGDVRSLVLRAQVLKKGKDAATANLTELAGVLETEVGLVDGVPFVETGTDEAVLVEAQRLASVPDSGVSRELVAMADVDAADLVEAEGLIPHSWSGEPKR